MEPAEVTYTEVLLLKELCYEKYKWDSERSPYSERRWTKKQQRDYLTNLMDGDSDDSRMVHFAFVTRGDGYRYVIDGHSRIETFFQYINGADRLYWKNGNDKVVMKCKGKLKRGYRLMTDDERQKFLNTVVSVDVVEFKNIEKSSRKRLREEYEELSNAVSTSA